MRIKPEIAFYVGEKPVYKCKCGAVFIRLDLLRNKRIRGEFEYCPQCKTKFVFEG